jgi:flagellar assembly factor FliW
MPTLTAVEIPELTFASGLPGFPEAHRFTMSFPFGDDSPFALLQSLDEPALQFVVVSPHLFFPDYAPEIDDGTVAALGIERAEDVLLLVVVNPGDNAGTATANLLAPVLVNVATLKGGQVVLDEDLPIRAPLLT